MSPLDVADNKVTERASSAYVPPLQRTEGQPPPIAAHGGLSYMAFDREGDAGTAAAIQDALAEIAEGEGQRVIDMIAKAPPGPIKTKWWLEFRDYDECLKYIRQSNSIKAPPDGVALPLPYTVYDAAEVERVYYPEIEKLLLEFLPDATDALVYNHHVFDKDYTGDRTEDQDGNNPGVNANYANLVHNDLNDNSGRVRCRELLTKNLRNFGREQHYTEEQADAKMSRRFMSINLAKPMETVGQNPFVLCAWPSFSDQPYITNYRVYDDRVGETTRSTYRRKPANR